MASRPERLQIHDLPTPMPGAAATKQSRIHSPRGPPSVHPLVSFNCMAECSRGLFYGTIAGFAAGPTVLCDELHIANSWKRVPRRTAPR